MRASRVRGPIARSIASITAHGPVIDSGSSTTRTFAPRRRVAYSGEFPQQKVRWLPLNLITQLLLRLQDAAWRRTNRTVIEISDIRIECPVLPHGMSEMFHTSKNRAPRLKKTGSEPHQIVSTRPEST